MLTSASFLSGHALRSGTCEHGREHGWDDVLALGATLREISLTHHERVHHVLRVLFEGMAGDANKIT